MNLSEVKIKGQVVEVTGFSGDKIITERLHELGIHTGSLVRVLGRAPFGGPLLVRFGNTFVALRKEEAACTTVMLK